MNKKKLSIIEKLSYAFNLFLDLIAPPKCNICDALLLNEEALCKNCLALWEKSRRERCPVCNKTARACTCRSLHLTDTDPIGKRTCSSLVFYKKFDPSDMDERSYMVIKFIQSVKTSPERSAVKLCARELSHELLKTLALNGESPDDWKITYPPRQKKRRKEFGFDHGQELASIISSFTGIKLEETLKNRGKIPQKHLNSLERRSNAKSSYVLKENVTPKGNYFIVDDIITTGSTINTAAAVLKEGGADRVYPLSIARSKNKKRPHKRRRSKLWFAPY